MNIIFSGTPQQDAARVRLKKIPSAFLLQEMQTFLAEEVMDIKLSASWNYVITLIKAKFQFYTQTYSGFTLVSIVCRFIALT